MYQTLHNPVLNEFLQMHLSAGFDYKSTLYKQIKVDEYEQTKKEVDEWELKQMSGIRSFAIIFNFSIWLRLQKEKKLLKAIEEYNTLVSFIVETRSISPINSPCDPLKFITLNKFEKHKKKVMGLLKQLIKTYPNAKVYREWEKFYSY